MKKVPHKNKKIHDKKYRQTHASEIAENKAKWYQENREAERAKRRKYYQQNKENILERTTKYRKENQEKINAWKRDYYQTDQGRERKRKSQRIYYNDRYKNDPVFKLEVVLRSRFRMAIKNNSKRGSVIRDLGCTIKELKEYLESMFQEGMNWGNWAVRGWHIDHIKPLSAFDLTNRGELLEACHYTNLQPLWAIDNISKGNKQS